MLTQENSKAKDGKLQRHRRGLHTNNFMTTDMFYSVFGNFSCSMKRKDAHSAEELTHTIRLESKGGKKRKKNMYPYIKLCKIQVSPNECVSSFTGGFWPSESFMG